MGTLSMNDARHSLVVVESEPEGYCTPAVVAGQRKTVVPQPMHHHDQVAGDSALGIAGVVCGRGWSARAAVPPQVRAHDRETTLDQLRCNAMPGRGGPGMTVQEQHGRTLPAVTDENGCFSDLPLLLHEVLEHRPSISAAFRAADR
jgi:hypothetical protein